MEFKKLSLALLVLLTVSLLLNGCSRSPSTGPTASQRSITGTITTGKPVSAATAPISPAGGTVTVTDPASPLAELEINVPPNAYSSATQFEVSYSPVEKHTFGEAFNPVTPMITIDNGGDYSKEIVEVKVPVTIPDGHFAMGFLYDDETKQLEGLPLLAQDADSITIGTRHFSNLVISIIDVALLYQEIDSGFRVGVDDWQFTNYGSSIAPEGHCSGQSMTAMWYYITRPDGKDVSLFGRYDNNGNQPATPKFWLDDSLAYRFSSVVQNDADWNSLLRKITRGILSKDPEITFRLFAYSMLLTGEPQYVAVANTKEGGGHALVLYRISGGKLYVSDPNYPGMALRYIEYTDGVFKPYSSGASAAEIEKGNGKEYDLIAYTAKTSLVDWGKISSRWEEVKNGTIGNDSFLSYKTVWLDDQGKAHELTDGTVSPDKILNISFQYQGGMPTRWSVYRDGVRLSAGQRIFPGTSSYELEPGNNKLGILLNAVINGQEQYIDFEYVNVVYNESPAKVWTLSETRINPPEGELSEPGRIRNDHTVAESGITHKTSFDSAQFGWNVIAAFTFDKKPPTTMKPGDVVILQTTGTISKSGNLPSNPLIYEFSYVSGYWKDNTLTTGDKPDYPHLSSVGGFTGLTLDSQESVASKTANVSFVVPQAQSEDIAIQAKEGNVSVTWIYKAR